MEVSNDANVRDVLILDASTGKLVNRYSLIHDGLYRELYEATYARKGLKWKEGDKFPGRLDVDQQNEVLATGESYWFFKNGFGRDSYDGAGHKMITVNNDPRISCPNANWNGVTTNYCSGVSSDDVVAHEWGHAYTEYTHGLIYQWQSGALNESYSDIWGETVDLINGRMDADEGDITAKRQVGVCSTHSPARPIVLINSPASIAKECEAGAASFGPQLDGTGVSGDVVPAVDNGRALPDGTPSPSTSDACTALTNASAVAGKVALLDRGTCAFTIKVKNARAAGATGVLVADNVEATPSGMSGVDPAITIPAVRIRLSDGNLIKSALPNGPVNVTMKDASGDRADSYRWLMGEDSSAFGGAIRDMWAPTCHGDPGKVSDAEYYCATDDGGGVHSNSGVPNHGYALLVDGGTYNGVTVKGLGLDKSAAIYFRAMTDYQTPTTDFADHADAPGCLLLRPGRTADPSAHHGGQRQGGPGRVDPSGRLCTGGQHGSCRGASRGPGAVRLQAAARPEHPRPVWRGWH
ncbi:M4 family metallopeptidase [Nocardioides sp. B-3]|uniref:M4 family metallopeptidase n=1 Tax=Nocardioides sp. B-3 TaxID=2895565 RepID=UPI003FA5D2D4